MEVNPYLEKLSYEEDTGLAAKDIADIEREIDFKYPMEYREMLKKINGGYGNIGDFYIDFWEVEDVLSYYDENEDLKNFVIFASDGCGVAFAFKKENRSIYSIPMDSLEEDYSKKIAENYSDFIKNICCGQLKY